MFGRSKKKKNPLEDEFGSTQPPYQTNDELKESYNINEFSGRKQSARKREAWIFRALALLLCLFLVVGFVWSCQNNIKTGNNEKAIGKLGSNAFKTRYDDMGRQVIESYFAQENPPLNLLDSVPWNGIESEDGNTETTDSAPVDVKNIALLDTNPINVASANLNMSEIKKDKTGQFTDPQQEVLVYRGEIEGKPYRFAVNLLIPDVKDSTKIPYLVSPPTILDPQVVLSSDVDASRPDDSTADSPYAEVELNEDAVDQLSTWASAYAQGQGDTLKRLTGDNDSSHEYRGLGGFSLIGSPTVEWSYEFSADNKKYIVTRIMFTMSTPVSNSDRGAENVTSSDSTDREFAPVQVMDLLLTDYAQGTPNITAWAGGGGWDNLTDYMNAVVIPDKDAPATLGEDGTDSDNDEDSDSSSTETSASETSTSSSTPVAPTLKTDSSKTSTTSGSSSRKKPSSGSSRTTSSSKHTTSRTSR